MNYDAFSSFASESSLQLVDRRETCTPWAIEVALYNGVYYVTICSSELYESYRSESNQPMWCFEGEDVK